MHGLRELRAFLRREAPSIGIRAGDYACTTVESPALGSGLEVSVLEDISRRLSADCVWGSERSGRAEKDKCG